MKNKGQIYGGMGIKIHFEYKKNQGKKESTSLQMLEGGDPPCRSGWSLNIFLGFDISGFIKEQIG